MAPVKQPKVLLFDIGGVCVVSPFQGILNYELSQGIPPGWINYAISKAAPNGAWHKLERGELSVNQTFFDGFNNMFRNAQHWASFWTQTQSKRGVSLDPSRDTVPALPTVDGAVVFWEIMRISRAPDPWMFPALKRLKASGRYLMGALSNTIILPADNELARPAELDPRQFFDVFVSSAHCGLRKPDPKIYAHAVEKLDEFARANADGKGRGLGWEAGVRPEEVLFLDDIGENLRAAKKVGFKTMKVNLGQAYDAVDELEEVTGLKLAGDHPRVSSAPKIPRAKL